LIPLVIEELKTQKRRYKPSPEYLQALCGAAITMQRAWVAVGFNFTLPPQEPSRWGRAPETPRRHKRRVYPID
jgi:hypothetical protein